jgi:type I restriction enzyme, S subunit
LKFQKYENTKPSEIPWVGEIPEEWDVRPLFAYCKENQEKNTSGKNDNVLSLSYGNIIRRNIEDNFGLLPDSFNSYQILKSGTIVLRLTDLQNDKKSLRVGLAKEQGIITSAYVGLLPNSKIIPEYLYYLLHSYDISKVFYGMGGGVRQSLSFSELKRLPLLNFSTEEQKQIVEFLIPELSKINSHILKHKQLIKILKEKEQTTIKSILNRKITLFNKITSKTKQKDWQTVRLKFLSQIKTGNKDTIDNEPDAEFPFFVRSKKAQKISTYSYDGEAVLTAGDGDIGKIFHYINGKFDYHQRVYKISNFKKILGKYCYYYMKENFYDYVIGLSAKTTVDSLRLDMVQNFPITYGTLDEQQQISDFLDEITSKIKLLITQTNSQIKNLQESYQSLIYSSVTGKICVTNQI